LLKILLIAGKSLYLGIAYGLFLIFISIIYVRIAMTTHALAWLGEPNPSLLLLIVIFIFIFHLLPYMTVACTVTSKETVLVWLS
jgi:hypothetical protein